MALAGQYFQHSPHNLQRESSANRFLHQMPSHKAVQAFRPEHKRCNLRHPEVLYNRKLAVNRNVTV